MLIRLSSILALLLIASAAIAEEPSRWYISIGSGAARTSAQADRGAEDAALTAQGFTEASSLQERASTPFRLSAGYRWSRRVALEAAYFDLSTVQHVSRSYVLGVDQVANTDRRWEASGIEVAALVSWPLSERFALVAKGSLYGWKGKHTSASIVADADTGVVLSSSEASARGSGVVPGLGVGFSTSAMPPIELRVMYEVLMKKTGLFGAGNDLKNIQILSVGLVFNL